MNLSCTTITLHPQTQNVLLKYFRTQVKLFADVLGHFEIDYMAITLLNAQKELLFLSTRPAIELKLIQENLWPFDESFQQDFFVQGKPRLWEELYHNEQHKLRYYKQEEPGFSMGISVPSHFEEYRVIYSFALKSTDEAIRSKIVNRIETLTNIGRFCLKNMIEVIPLPDRQQHCLVKKPSLKLIINNKV